MTSNFKFIELKISELKTFKKKVSHCWQHPPISHLSLESHKGRENFSTWKVGAKAHLITRGYWIYIGLNEPPKEPKEILADQRALAELTLLVDSNLYTNLEDCEYAKEA